MAVALRDFDHGQRRPRLRVVPSPPPAPPRHVFWLRRLLAIAVLIGLLIAATVAVRATTASRADEPIARTNLTVVLGPGETLWDLAERYAPADRDLVDWADEIARLNRVDAQSVQPGTPLVVPLETAAVSADPGDGSAR